MHDCNKELGDYIPIKLCTYVVGAFAYCSRLEFLMFITPAYAQTAGAGGPDIFIQLVPFIAIFVIMYFLIIRPQRQQMKRRQEMLDNVRRNDTVITGGGMVGKVTKVGDDGELEVEIASGIKVKVLRSMLADVRVKGQPVAANDQKK